MSNLSIQNKNKLLFRTILENIRYDGLCETPRVWCASIVRRLARRHFKRRRNSRRSGEPRAPVGRVFRIIETHENPVCK